MASRLAKLLQSVFAILYGSRSRSRRTWRAQQRAQKRENRGEKSIPLPEPTKKDDRKAA